MIKIELLLFTPKWIESFKQEKRELYSLIGKDPGVPPIPEVDETQSNEVG